jgi:CRISPR-associated protein Cas2
MFVVLAYDISDDKRRLKAEKACKNFLDHSQLSVFDGELEEPVLERLLRDLSPLLKEEADSLRVYRLCGSCEGKVRVLGAGGQSGGLPKRATVL